MQDQLLLRISLTLLFHSEIRQVVRTVLILKTNHNNNVQIAGKGWSKSMEESASEKNITFKIVISTSS